MVDTLGGSGSEIHNFVQPIVDWWARTTSSCNQLSEFLTCSLRKCDLPILKRGLDYTKTDDATVKLETFTKVNEIGKNEVGAVGGNFLAA